MVELTVEKAQEGAVLHELLVGAYPDFPPKALNLAFKTGIITRNGQEAGRAETVCAGDVVRIFAPGDVLGVDLTPRVVYQDENFVFVDKPAGLLSASDTGEPNAVDMVEAHMKRRGEYSLNALMVPYLIYPLDAYVSGLLLMAKHEDAYLFLVEALAQRRIARYFICPVVGQAKDKDELLAYHLREKSNRSVRILPKFQKDAKPIVTRYQALATGETMSLLRVRPVTNGLHQVRSHLAYARLPVLGDDLYGNRRFNKKAGAEHISLWLHSLVMEVGTAHSYAYINGFKFESTAYCFPKCVYDEGLLEI
jgi:23S rRNA pseudouridine1911/1915/1917 synthase